LVKKIGNNKLKKIKIMVKIERKLKFGKNRNFCKTKIGKKIEIFVKQKLEKNRNLCKTKIGKKNEKNELSKLWSKRRERENRYYDKTEKILSKFWYLKISWILNFAKGAAFDSTLNWVSDLVASIQEKDRASIAVVQFSGNKQLAKAYKPGDMGKTAVEDIDHFRVEQPATKLENIGR